MNEFSTFFKMGLDHILDVHAYDHLLFIISLLIVYSLKDYRSVIVVLTAFTLGHAISLLSGLLEFIPLTDKWIEFLIPVTIILMSVYHLLVGKGKRTLVYTLTVLFGLIHGLAYAKDFLLMMQGSSEVLVPLLGFNLGVEVAQIAFGLLFILLMELSTSVLKLQRSSIVMFIFGVIITLSLQLLIVNRIW